MGFVRVGFCPGGVMSGWGYVRVGFCPGGVMSGWGFVRDPIFNVDLPLLTDFFQCGASTVNA